MCGLYGFITRKSAKLTSKEKTIRGAVLEGLAVAMEERGTHSSGVAFISSRNIEVVKEAIPARQLVNGNDFREQLATDHWMAIGHTRFATVGAKTDENSHPFHVGNIVGAHNGWVSNYLQIDNKVNVDSQVIFNLLNESDNNYEKVFKKLRGTFAITWFNKLRNDELYFVKDTNPLFLILVPEIQTYFWSSIELPLASIIQAFYGLEGKEIWNPEDEMVFAINKNLTIFKKKVEFGKYTYTQPKTTPLFPKDDTVGGCHWNGSDYVYTDKYDEGNLIPDKVQDIVPDRDKIIMPEDIIGERCVVCNKIVDVFKVFYLDPYQFSILHPACRVMSKYNWPTYEIIADAKDGIDIDQMI